MSPNAKYNRKSLVEFIRRIFGIDYEDTITKKLSSARIDLGLKENDIELWFDDFGEAEVFVIDGKGGILMYGFSRRLPLWFQVQYFKKTVNQWLSGTLPIAPSRDDKIEL